MQATNTQPWTSADFDELETLINEQQKDSESANDAKQVEELCDLDQLLRESVKAVEEDRSIKKHRSMLVRKNLPAEAREDLEAKVREWEARKVWETLAHVAVFHRQQCACGSIHLHFSHMMLHQRHRTDTFAQRWVRETVFANTQTRKEIAGLPNKVAFQNTHVPICHVCAAEAGFDLNAQDCLSWEVIQLAQEV